MGTWFSLQRAITTTILLLAAAGLTACGNLAGAPAPTEPRAELEFGQLRTLTPRAALFSDVDLQSVSVEVPRLWFVEVDAPATIYGGIATAQASRIDQVQAAAGDAGIELSTRYTFGTFATGFSAEVAPEDVLALSNLQGVVRVSPVGLVAPPSVLSYGDAPVLPDVTNARAQTGADLVYDDGVGLTGAGVKVGIIDTGILHSHPAFAGRIPAGSGFDFVGDAYDASGTVGSPVPTPQQPDPIDDDPLVRRGGGDCNGHGTHVAGIVGADDANVLGVAPGVELHAYRVFGCEGSSADDVILAAIERAFADGMDVVNLSLGSTNGFPDDFLARALARMADVGMVAVASAGNNGRSGLYTIGSPGAGDDVITVASFDNSVVREGQFQVADRVIGYQPMTGSVDAPVTGSEPVVFVGLACDAGALEGDPSGAVALVARGACAFSAKAANAAAAGATAVVIYNTVDATYSGTLGGVSIPVPVVGIPLSDGLFVAEQASPTLTWLPVAEVPVDTAGLVSTFSSYGLAPDLSLKPDLGAPGGLIYSTMITGAAPGVAGSPAYETLSGTSMSSPHVAGAVALLLEQRPGLTPAEVRDVLLNTAIPQPDAYFTELAGATVFDSVHRQGAGMLRIDRAVVATTSVLPSKLSLGESAALPFSELMTLRNDGDEPITYALTQIELFAPAIVGTIGTASGDAFGTFAPQALAGAPLAFVEYVGYGPDGSWGPLAEVTVPAGGVASFEARVTPNPGLPDTTIYGTYLVFVPQGPAGEVLFVPAAGYVGDYQATEVALTPPLLYSLYDEFVPPYYPFSMFADDVPGFLFGVGHGVDAIVGEIVPLDERAWIGPQPGFEYALVPRNSVIAGTTNIGLYYFGFGDLDLGPLPSGTYSIRISMLKAEGDPTNPAHVEVWETDPFVIDRDEFALP